MKLRTGACAGLIERKREAAERRVVEERERRERLQLEEAFEDRKKTTSVPTDVRPLLCMKLHTHIQMIIMILR